MQATVLAPDSVLIPFLPVRRKDRLLFPLCEACVSENAESYCRHSDKQRALLDVWTTEEVHFAVRECGYKLVRVHEALLFRTMGPVFRSFYLHLARMKLGKCYIFTQLIAM